MSENTAAYSNARNNLPLDIVSTVYEHSVDFGTLEKESWHGMHTYISDGTYLQLQDTKDIKERYPITAGHENAYPQALLQVLIRQGSGQISQFGIGPRQDSELQLVIPMIGKLIENDLLLADDLYNSYYHFALVVAQKAHMIVQGKRDRNYKVIQNLPETDQLVELSKTDRPDYVSREE